MPTLFLAAADDGPIPVTDVRALSDRALEPKRMFIMSRADHQHFLDNVETEHEVIRAMSFPGDAAWITSATLPRNSSQATSLPNWQRAASNRSGRRRGLWLTFDRGRRRHRRFVPHHVEVEKLGWAI